MTPSEKLEGMKMQAQRATFGNEHPLARRAVSLPEQACGLKQSNTRESTWWDEKRRFWTKNTFLASRTNLTAVRSSFAVTETTLVVITTSMAW